MIPPEAGFAACSLQLHAAISPRRNALYAVPRGVKYLLRIRALKKRPINLPLDNHDKNPVSGACQDKTQNHRNTMKTFKTLLLSLSLVLFGGASAFAQQAVAGGPEISVDKEVHDYGTIKEGSNGVAEFTITNTGNEPLIISRAKGSCGCTVPDWPKEPIMPGKSAKMSVSYDTKRVGPINKSVTITSNASNAATKVVRIKGNVLASENASGTPLKKQAGAPVVN